MKGKHTDYKLIPMSDITDEARELAVAWGANMQDDFIKQKHKLASDIMNYARRYHESQMEKLVHKEFADELMDSVYQNGKKEDEKYTLTLPQMEQVAVEIFSWIKKKIGC